MNSIFRYAMGISVKLLDDNSKIYADYSLGIGEPEFQMLNHLNEYNSVESANEVIQELTKVTNKSQEFWGWGTDFCLITSYAEKSVIEHHINPDNGDWAWIQSTKLKFLLFGYCKCLKIGNYFWN